MSGFRLDPRLAADTSAITDLALCRVLLVEDRRFPWLILVPRREEAREIVDLGEADAAMLMGEIRRVCQALLDLVAPDKLNVAALGNVVPQLHVHIVARDRRDLAWPKPVWGFGAPDPYEPAARQAFAGDLRRALA